MSKKKKPINSLSDLIVASLKTKEIIKSIKRQNGSLLGREAAQTLDRVLDADIGNKKSYQIEKHIIPFVIDFCDGFTEELLK